LVVSALEFMLNIIKMKNLIIDAAADRIFFKVIADTESYTSDYANSRENFDKLVTFLFSFLNENKINIKEIDNIFVNQGPGKFSGIRASIAIAKALSIANKQDLYGFSSNDIMDKNYNKIIDLYKKGILIKNLIKPQY
tara:strand:+ start:112 stop:525 length:414 start_codon:yes stop_codon:yes gene_type:complete